MKRIIAALLVAASLLPVGAKAQTSTVLIPTCAAFADAGTAGRTTRYVLAKDIPAAPNNCLTFQSVSPHATLDGQNHKLLQANSLAVHLLSVTYFTVTNIAVTGNPRQKGFTGYQPTDSEVYADRSPFTSVINSAFNDAGVYINGPFPYNNPPDPTGSHDSYVGNNQFINSTVTAGGNNTSVMNNSFTFSENYSWEAAIIIWNYNGTTTISSPLSGNKVQGNTINGGWNGSPAPSLDGKYPMGLDDGINVISAVSASNENISNNTIQNVWDAGVETIGSFNESVINQNTIGNANLGGITSYYGTSWTGDTVSGNNVSNSGLLLYLDRIANPDKSQGLMSGEQYVYFKNNNFIGNTFVTRNNADTAYIDFTNDWTNDTKIPASDWIATGNAFTGNNFGTVGFSPVFNPYSSIIDGGGNKCPGLINGSAAGYPLKCK